VQHRYAVPALLFCLVMLQAVAVASRERAISPYDEGAHFDYVVQMRHGTFPVPAGQRYTDEAVQEWACRPHDRAGSIEALCGRETDYGQIPFMGVNYEAPFGPVYYGAAAAAAVALEPFGVSDFLAARLTSCFLFALGAALLALLAQRLGATRRAAFGAVLAASSTGLALGTGASISPDAMSFGITALGVGVALLVRSQRAELALCSIVGVFAGLTKPNFFVIALLVAGLILLKGLGQAESGRERLARVGRAGLPVALSLAASGAWSRVADARNRTGLPFDGNLHEVLQSQKSLASRVADHLAALLSPQGGTPPGPPFTALSAPLPAMLSYVVVLLLFGAVLLAVVANVAEKPAALQILRAVAFAAPAAAVLFTAIYTVGYENAHSPASRYGLPLLGAAAVGVALVPRRREAAWLVALGVVTWLGAWSGLLAHHA
jgi:hypothetical protein